MYLFRTQSEQEIKQYLREMIKNLCNTMATRIEVGLINA